MENEIELKIMLCAENIPTIENWLQDLPCLKTETQILGNTYYDTSELYFAKQQMGLRVRHKNHQYELTLKTKGEIIGGLHIRPEYNLTLPNSTPNFKQLVLDNDLQFDDTDYIHNNLIATFDTNFTRKIWLIKFNQSEIEIALDQGVIQNPMGKDTICEIEFELKKGSMNDLFHFLNHLPKIDGMWLSSLSKAQRGYLVGNLAAITQECEKLIARDTEKLSNQDKYQYEQQLVDLIRITDSFWQTKLLRKYEQLIGRQCNNDIAFFSNSLYLTENLQRLYATTQVQI